MLELGPLISYNRCTLWWYTCSCDIFVWLFILLIQVGIPRFIIGLFKWRDFLDSSPSRPLSDWDLVVILFPFFSRTEAVILVKRKEFSKMFFRWNKKKRAVNRGGSGLGARAGRDTDKMSLPCSRLEPGVPIHPVRPDPPRLTVSCLGTKMTVDQSLYPTRFILFLNLHVHF